MGEVAVVHAEPVARQPRKSRPSLPGKEGWVPAHDDRSQLAVDWRSVHAFNRSEDAHEEIGLLRESVDALTKALNTALKLLNTLAKGAWAIALPLIIMVIAGFSAVMWRLIVASPK